jgi:hypothetical protein
MSEEHNKSIKKMLHVSNTPTAFTDGVNVACRIDGCVLLQFISDTPTIAFENFRTIMNKDNAIQLIDNLAKALNHYPTPDTPAPVASSPAKKNETSRVKS